MAEKRPLSPLANHLVKRSAYLEAFSKGKAGELRRVLSELERDIERRLSALRPDSTFTKGQLNAALSDVRSLYRESEEKTAAKLDALMEDFVKADNRALKKILNGASVDFETPAVKQALAVLDLPVQMGEIGGLSYGRWVQKLYDDSHLKVEAMLRNIAGKVLIGEDIATISRSLQKNFDLSRTAATTLARTTIAEAHSNLSLKTYKDNQDVLEGVEWLATLDDRTCEICMPLDGQVFYYDPKRGQKSIEQMPGLPIHANCRCVAIPVVEGFGAEDTQTYEEWFNTQDADTQRDILGASRYELWKDGDVALGGFSMHGAILTLDELEATL